LALRKEHFAEDRVTPSAGDARERCRRNIEVSAPGVNLTSVAEDRNSPDRLEE
jgi:hypothetical protein